MKKRTTLNQSFWEDPEKKAQEARLKKLLSDLNFNNIKEYFKWCEEKGFSRTLNKSNYLLLEEQGIRKEELRLALDEKERAQRKEVSHSPLIRRFAQDIENSCKVNSHLEQPWSQMKKYLRPRCLFSDNPFSPGSVSEHNYFVHAYFKLAKFSDLFSCEIKDLKIKKSNPEAYFQEVVSRLVSRYPLPKAFISWWFHREEKWAQAYISLVQGKKVYEVFKEVEKIPLTHRQIKLLITKFSKNTSSYSKARIQAILASLGAPGKLESSIIRSDIFLEYLDNNYSLKLDYLSFLVKNANFFDWDRTLDLWDYIIHLRGATPAFSFKGRTLLGLIEGMHAWHVSLGLSKQLVDDKRSWEKTSIGDYHFVNEKTTEEYMITELTSGRAIHAEGKIMHHCVYSYVARCENKNTAIFSLKHKVNNGSDWKSAGTIELDLNRSKVVQFKAKFNASPEAGAHFHLRKWAEKENLKV